MRSKIARYLTVLPVIFVLGACSATTATKNVYQPIDIPKSITRCDPLTAADFPNPEAMTNSQLHDLIVLMFRNNQECAANMTAIKKYVEQTNFNILSLNQQ